MAGRMLNLDDLDSLIKATQKYKDTLIQNYEMLLEAGNACAWAMGNDALAARQLQNLEDAVTELEKTIDMTESVIEALKYDYRIAIDILEEAGHI